MTSPRLIFLDVDGTYADHSFVPEAHADAVRRLRANGHKVFLCTGRARCMVTESILSAGFDGVVTGAGARAELDGEVLQDMYFPASVGATVVNVLERYNAIFMLESSEAVFARPDMVEALEERFKRRGADSQGVHHDIVAAMRPVESFDGIPFAKAVTISADAAPDVVAAEAGPSVDSVETSLKDLGTGAGEFYLAGVTKETGIRAIVERLGASAADVVAAGDGQNDIEMLAYAGTAIGVEDGHEDALALADIVAKPPTEAGLVAAFKELGLI